ncbi:hypothetical protein DRE_00298 [Drechslerella stenobrocha 248]|uniref:Uncharacterized protein n=1 Tax=Drechslerella stenobrocha 248 TaxID=1043628 RepID=W7IE85_9PEZI|nr:hypothetical protein DRE_00298 [Drechslerella stenobrocha 248]
MSETEGSRRPPVMMDYTPAAQCARRDLKEANHDHSELCISHITAHLKSAEIYRSQLDQILHDSGASGATGVPALTTIAMRSMINSLREDPSMSNFDTVVNHAPASLLNSIIDSPKLHYTSMLRFTEQKGWDKVKDDSRRDIWILRNEYYARADGTDWALLDLDDAHIVFKHCSEVVDNGSNPPYRLITRKIAPKSGFQYLDQLRPRTLAIQPSTEAYQKTFNRLMNGALDGLDWSNIFVAGGMALSALLCVDESMDNKYISNDVDMYLYGLTPDQANEKVKHIANVWKKNLNPNEEYTMVKNSKTITLVGTFPRRRVQIILKMIKNPATVLLNFDLDQVAVGYTGESVLLLPRCARALETGYSIFTLDMIHGHHLNERRETQEERLIRYARRGFGVRILPEFCAMAKVDFRKRRHTRSFIHQAVGDLRRGWYDTDYEDPPGIEDPSDKVASGLKAVRRIFAAGEDMVHRFFLGVTEVSAPDDYDDILEFYAQHEDDENNLPKAYFNDLDTRKSGVGIPYGRRGIGPLEFHARHCAMFRFEHEKKITVDYKSMASLVYDPDSYDMTPKYDWCENFKPKQLTDDIDKYNNSLFHMLCEALENDPEFSDRIATNRLRLWKDHLKGYLTRRVRRMAHSQDIDQLVDRFQIVLPILVGSTLEEWIKDTFAQALEDAGLSSANHEILIPVHKPGMGSGFLPELTENITTDNLRYWVTDSTTIWAGLDRRIDEISEVLWVLAMSKELVEFNPLDLYHHEEFTEDWYSVIANLLLRRVAKASIQQLGIERVEGTDDSDDESPREFIHAPVPDKINPLNIPNERDQYLFTKWLTERPVAIYRSYQYEAHRSYREKNNNRGLPDRMYWREGIDGTSDEWTEWQEGQPGFEYTTTFRPVPMPRAGRPADGGFNDDEQEDGDGDNNGDDGGDGGHNGNEDAEGEPHSGHNDDNSGSPRGLKRRREPSDPTTVGGKDTPMADAPGGTS